MLQPPPSNIRTPNPHTYVSCSPSNHQLLALKVKHYYFQTAYSSSMLFVCLRALTFCIPTNPPNPHTCIRQLFTIQPPRSTRSSSTLTLLRPSVDSSLNFSNRSIAVAVPPLWNKLPPSLRQISDPSYE